jgi:phosphopantetheinyl transferase
VDVEDRARAALDRNLVARYCSPAERAEIDAHGEAGWQDRFLQYWTLKEAYLKALDKLPVEQPTVELTQRLVQEIGQAVASGIRDEDALAATALQRSNLRIDL